MKIFYILIILFVTNAWSLSEGITEKYHKENAKLIKEREAGKEIISENYTSGLKEIYWRQYESRGMKILNNKKLDDKVKPLHEEFLQLKESLEDLEYKEVESDKLEERVSIHLKSLNDKIYHTRKFVFVDYVTWQSEANIRSATSRKSLIVTSNGFCAGGGWGYKNAFYHAFLDGCLLYGHSNVGAEVNSLTYKQSNIPTYGFKGSIGAGMIVSSLGVEVGLKLPMLYSDITLDSPDQNKFPGYKVDEENLLMPMASLYTRWPVKKWFFQTEFTKVIGQDLTFWALGAGLTF